MAPHGWHVVIPVKDTRHGKSRLARPAGPDRAVLSRAIADDTIAAAVGAVGAGRVLLVTADAGLAEAWAPRGVRVVADPDTGLNGAIAHGLTVLPTGAWAAALLGDLPCLTPPDLCAALDAAALHADSFVPDADGTGTVLRCGRSFRPRFGPGSASSHEAGGATRLDLDLPRLRTDVDDATSLARARVLGLGPATSAVIERLGSGWIHSMQATVHTFDPADRSGSVLLDDGLELPFTQDAFDPSGLRLLRIGQRLTVDVVDHHVVAMRIVGIGPGQPIR
ncbi:2-phospho-L-lactate guanylyltransferase [Intrasporangium oryzae NRRL B-24470]|uniref:2-phospho-L-lactate guanylyltransferase n=1 Tax=Intrasporangium oryzae NRRL B-24470 TaxID=1386089 RepID=W9G8G7_9MICO|nr:2-phospho-L-lactate guanylyltransferase [Intrasporangium oryzae NRRL B-24470]